MRSGVQAVLFGGPMVPGLPKWSHAFRRAKAGSYNAHICCVGDSTTTGYGAGSAASYTGAKPLSYPSVLSTLLQARGIPTSTATINGLNGTNGGQTLLDYDTSLTLAAGTASWVGNGATFGEKIIQFVDNTAKISWAPGISFDTLDIWIANSANATCGLYLDGSGSVNTTLTSTTGTTLKKTVVSVTPGVHTVEFAKLSGTNFFLIGVTAYNAGGGRVLVHNGGWSGGKSSNLSGAASVFDYLPMMNAIGPDLTIISQGINDQAATVLGTFTTNYQATIDKARLTGDVVMVVPHAISSGGANEVTYHDAIRALAASNNIPCVDINARWGSYATANSAGLMSDTVHPSGLGYADIAAAIAARISR